MTWSFASSTYKYSLLRCVWHWAVDLFCMNILYLSAYEYINFFYFQLTDTADANIWWLVRMRSVPTPIIVSIVIWSSIGANYFAMLTTSNCRWLQSCSQWLMLMFYCVLSTEHWSRAMQRVWKQFMPLPLNDDDMHPCSFTPIFSDQYAASYYSIKWSEVVYRQSTK